MKFIDEATIHVQAGKGGSGSRHFRREKYVPQGGPDGGDGGGGGSVILLADSGKHTLLDFKFHPHWKAENGSPGEGRNKRGQTASDIVIKVPLGTQVFNAKNDALLADLTSDKEKFVLAQGGRGGKGNAFFKSPTNRTPEHFQPGEAGAGGDFRLSLKLVADVGLIGLPNAGKSTLISRISAARPKVADYPFTTLTPNLGVVRAGSDREFVVADIPGLIPDAHKGKGLGVQFLKHIERTRILAHLIDISTADGKDAIPQLIEAFEQISHELKSFSEELASKPQIVVLTKLDAASDRQLIESAQQQFIQRGLTCLVISSASGEGLDQLTGQLAKMLVE